MLAKFASTSKGRAANNLFFAWKSGKRRSLLGGERDEDGEWTRLGKGRIKGRRKAVSIRGRGEEGRKKKDRRINFLHDG